MLKVWITGANGQVGTAINRVVEPLDFEIMNTDMDELDVTVMEEVLRFAQINRPDVIINCAAVTDVKKCEENPKNAYLVNALGARNLAIAARKSDAVMVQISTDDVFDGKATEPYKEFDETNPITVYGKSKLSAEHYVKEFTQKHFIIRSTWVYGHTNNFVSTILKRAETESVLNAASDQFGSPTSAKELAQFILTLIRTNLYGTYHATSEGICSRYEFAQEILRLAGKNNELHAVLSDESELSNIRPPYAVLENFILSCENTYSFPHWKDSLAEFIKEEVVS
ncbi:MAG: dTDP-4-dehydrorhamnose reductase [Lachnospiraceae bacterium]|jgi:dTDP-4-dehydrorhamnose reductase|nr:dTDP-4-dehydrorhamnose reductase [Lachnospiraceae bacterium]MDD3614843.1 dTDP-4-dehydrorhamnose reductase [Lachnospiraceae bacterium]